MSFTPEVLFTKPNNFDPRFKVASCFCTCQKKLLLLQNAPEKSYGNNWGAPGGKMEEGESPLHAALRETLEETLLKFSEDDLQFFGTFYVRYPDFDFLFHVFTVELSRFPDQITLRTQEHKGYAWVTAEEILHLPLIPGGYACFTKVYGNPPKFIAPQKSFKLQQ